MVSSESAILGGKVRITTVSPSVDSTESELGVVLIVFLGIELTFGSKIWREISREG